MRAHKTLESAVRDGDVQIVEMNRADARDIEGLVNLDESEVERHLLTALDVAQGSADTKGLYSFVVLKIAGGPL